MLWGQGSCDGFVAWHVVGAGRLIQGVGLPVEIGGFEVSGVRAGIQHVGFGFGRLGCCWILQGLGGSACVALSLVLGRGEMYSFSSWTSKAVRRAQPAGGGALVRSGTGLGLKGSGAVRGLCGTISRPTKRISQRT